MSIFVSIASYEDPFLVETIKDALNKAKNPDDLFFAVALQYDKILKPNLDFINKENIIVLDIPVSKRPGLVRTRYILRKMLTFQDYFLQIDSHMKFDYNWDVKLINDLLNLKKITHDKVLISKRLSTNFGKILGTAENSETRFFLKDEDLIKHEDNILLLIDTYEEEIQNKELLDNYFYRSYMASGHFIFCSGDLIKNTNTDCISQNFYEEMMDSFYFYIQGCDIYSTYGYNHLSHNNTEYKKIVYGPETLDPSHPSNQIITRNSYINEDDFSIYKSINQFILYSVVNRFDIGCKRRRSNCDFFKAIGLEGVFHHFKGIVPN
jgi:hypothetical protein